MANRYKMFFLLVWLVSFLLFASGCIRLFGRAGYVTEKPMERTERVVGFDTAQAFQSQQSKGNVST